MTNDQLAKATAAWLRGRAAVDRSFAELLDPSGVLPLPVPPTKPGTLIPAYFSPSKAPWTQILAAAEQLAITAIANPSSGPGTTRNAAYVDLIAKMTAAGVRMIGYVASGYGNRPAGEVRSDIATWYGFYPSIGGIFFDQQSTKPEHISLYGEYFADVRGRGGYVASNAGTRCPEGYWTVSKPHCLVLWENQASAGEPSLPEWAIQAPPELDVCGLVHHADLATMRRLVPRMREIGFDSIFITKSASWDSLGDWDAFVTTLLEAR